MAFYCVRLRRLVFRLVGVYDFVLNRDFISTFTVFFDANENLVVGYVFIAKLFNGKCRAFQAYSLELKCRVIKD